jgi:acid phosphatase family membrane protein YuiD
VRREAGKHAVSIKELADAVNQMAKDQDVEVKIEKLKILVGHTPLQVYAGAVLGFMIAFIGILLQIESKWFIYPENWINLINFEKFI